MKYSVGSDNPNTLGSDKHINALGLSDATKKQVGLSLVAFCRELVTRLGKMPSRSDYPTVRKSTSDKGSGDSAESMCCRDRKLPSGSDDPMW